MRFAFRPVLIAGLSLLACPAAAQTGPAPAPATAFDDMLAHVYQDSPRLRSEREAVRILDEKVSATSAGFRPSLGFQGEEGEARVSVASEPWRYGEDRNLALTAVQPIYNGAAIGQWRAARQRVTEGRARLLSVEQKVLYAAVAAWLDLYEKQAILDLEQENLSLTRRLLDATRMRQQAGDGTITDVAIAQSREAQGETKVALAMAARDAAQAVFARATGAQPGLLVLPHLPRDLPHDAADATRQAAEHPDLAAADQEVAAAENDIDAADGARWPTVSLRGTMSEQHAEELDLSSLRGDSITINASFPLYQGGVEYAHIREAKLAHEKSRFDRLAIRRDVDAEAAEAWQRYASAQDVVTQSDRATASAAQAFNGVSEEQKHGIRSLSETLDAQAQTLASQETAVTARTGLTLAAYRLLAAAGRMTAQDLQLPVQIYDPVAHYDAVADKWFGTSNGGDK